MGAKDTLVNVSFFGKGECVPQKFPSIRSLDDIMPEQWLENFSLFCSHLMTKTLADEKQSQTQWIGYETSE